MEELITTVVLVAFNFALDVRDSFTYQSRAAAYYEVERIDSVPESSASVQYRAQSKGRTGLASKRVFHRFTDVDSHKRLGTAVKAKSAG